MCTSRGSPKLRCLACLVRPRSTRPQAVSGPESSQLLRTLWASGGVRCRLWSQWPRSECCPCLLPAMGLWPSYLSTKRGRARPRSQRAAVPSVKSGSRCFHLSPPLGSRPRRPVRLAVRALTALSPFTGSVQGHPLRPHGRWHGSGTRAERAVGWGSLRRPGGAGPRCAAAGGRCRAAVLTRFPVFSREDQDPRFL